MAVTRGSYEDLKILEYIEQLDFLQRIMPMYTLTVYVYFTTQQGRTEFPKTIHTDDWSNHEIHINC